MAAPNSMAASTNSTVPTAHPSVAPTARINGAVKVTVFGVGRERSVYLGPLRTRGMCSGERGKT
jgi:hypothetical protein